MTSQQLTINGGTTTYGAGGAWAYNAAALVPNAYANYSYAYTYQTFNGSTLMSSTTGTVTLGYNGQTISVNNQQTIPGTPATPDNVVFPLPGAPALPTGAASIDLYLVPQGSTAPATPIPVSVVNGQAIWNADGYATGAYSYFYSAFNASGTMLPSTSGTAYSQGYLTLAANGYSSTTDQISWTISTSTNGQKQIQRLEAYDAFGNIISETDGNNNTTNLIYNTEGKLIEKVSPSVSVTSYSGSSTTPQPGQQQPSEYYYYDVSGRLVGEKDANGNLTALALQAGSGYNGGAALTTAQYNPDGSTVRNTFDAFGDTLTSTDGDGNVTNNIYDNSGNLIEVDHPVRSGGNSSGVQLKDYYTYDALGHRIKTTNSELGAAVAQTTDYDIEGRVTRSVDFAGLSTQYQYAFVSGTSAPTVGLGNFGGYQTTTTNSAGLASYVITDIFGHETSSKDFGGYYTGYIYNHAGELIQQEAVTSSGTQIAGGQNIAYAYYGNGYIASTTDNTLGMQSLYEYDNNGNRTLETDTGTGASPTYYENTVISYDADNRVTEIKDPKADITYKYDANGNRIEVKSIYTDGVGGAVASQDYWYMYDQMNRFTLTLGALQSNGTVGIGSTGVQITYDAAGNRHSASYGSDGHTETYTYTADGYLEDTIFSGGSVGGNTADRTYDALGRVTQYTEYTASTGQNTLSRSDTFDNDNRVTYDQTSTVSGSGGSATTNVTSTYYDYKTFVSGSTGGIHQSVYTDAYTGVDSGVVQHTYVTQATNGTTSPVVTNTLYNYLWYDQAKQSTIRTTGADPTNPNATGWAPGVSNFTYDVNGHIQTLTDVAGNKVTSYAENAYGEILVSQQFDGTTTVNSGSLGPRTLYYYVDGNTVGDVSNNGPAPNTVDYAQSLQSAGASLSGSTSDFRYGKPISSADFDQNYQPINASYPGSAPYSYTVQANDTLTAIAQRIWGDSSLWYLIANANGLTLNSALVAGESLAIPNVVTNFHNNTSTIRPYQPGQIIGDGLPTLPGEPAAPAPSGGSGGCGIIGEILVAAISIAVQFIPGVNAAFDTINSALGSVFGSVLGATDAVADVAADVVTGALSAATDSLVGQGVGVATGLQSGINWSNIGLAAISGGVGGGLSNVNVLQGAGFIQGAERGIVGGVVSQGLDVATGLESNFDWVGVAASGIGGGVQAGISGSSFGRSLGLFGDNFLSGAAGLIARAVTQSVIAGTDFGDNVTAALPQFIGNTIGNAIAGGISQQDNTAARGQEQPTASPPAQSTDNSAGGDYTVPATNIPTYVDGFLLNPDGSSSGLFTNVVDRSQDFNPNAMQAAGIHAQIANLATGQTLSQADALTLAAAENIDPYQPFFVGGGGEAGSGITHIVSDYANGSLSQIQADGYSAGANFAGYSDTQRIQDYIEITAALAQTTALIGHSYGADAVFDAAIYAAHRDIDVDSLVTIDPVSGWDTHTIDQANFVKSNVGQWIDVRSTTSDGSNRLTALNPYSNLDGNDRVKVLGGPMPTDVQAVASPYYFTTPNSPQYDHGGFASMYNTYAKSYVAKLYN